MSWYDLGTGLLIVATIALWFAIEWISDYRRRQKIDPLASAWLEAANVASDLIPRFDPQVDETTTIYIVGNDGLYSDDFQKQQIWVDALCKWVSEKRASIYYLLIHPDPSKIGGLISLQERFPDRFFLRTCDPQDVADPGLRDRVDSLETFHPVLLKNKAGSVMWIEGYHPRGSSVAYSVEYVPSNPEKNDATRFGEFSSTICKLLQLKDKVEGLERRT